MAGMAGPDKGLSCVATVTVIEPNDGADQLLNHDLYPHWNGIRKKFLLSFPTNMKLWSSTRRSDGRAFRRTKTFVWPRSSTRRTGRRWTKVPSLRGIKSSFLSS